MSKMTKDQFVAAASIMVEKHFPKGETQMRGEAMVLVADMCRYLMEQKVIGDDEMLTINGKKQHGFIANFVGSIIAGIVLLFVGSILLTVALFILAVIFAIPVLIVWGLVSLINLL